MGKGKIVLIKFEVFFEQLDYSDTSKLWCPIPNHGLIKNST